MGGLLGPVVSSKWMTEWEKVIARKLIKEKFFISCARYVDDTLFIIRKNDISYHFGNFDKNLKITIDTFENSVLHFLDIEVCPIVLGIYHKHTKLLSMYTLWR